MKQRIETNRLTLRDFRESDAPALLDFLRAPHVNCFVSDRLDTYDNTPDGTPRYEDTCIYAILKKEWNQTTSNQWNEKYY